MELTNGVIRKILCCIIYSGLEDCRSNRLFFQGFNKGALPKCSQWLWTCQAVVESRAKLQSYLFYQDVVTHRKRKNLLSPFLNLPSTLYNYTPENSEGEVTVESFSHLIGIS